MDSSNSVQRRELPARHHIIGCISHLAGNSKAQGSAIDQSRKSLRFHPLRPLLLRKDFNFQPNQLES